MDTFGFNIPDQIRDNIGASDVLICDITHPNMNVYYEVGFAIGSGKTIAPVINTSFARALSEIQKDGLFDNIGFKTYDNAAQLEAALLDTPGPNLVELYGKELNSHQPFYILDTYRKTDFRNAIVSAIKSQKGFYRSFDPVELPRFSTVSIIAEATASAGIIIPLLGDNIDDAARHNIRAAFLAGLGHGLGRQTLILQMTVSEDTSAPADYREFVKLIRSEKDIQEIVAEFVRTALVDAQSIRTAVPHTIKSALQKLSLGAAAAENEFRTLEDYFVETSEFSRTLRGEIRLVAGRKGSGKTAIFFRVRDTLRVRKGVFVIDLKPESHQLSLFREELLKTVGAGVFDHTLAAFWYLVLLSEMLLTIKDRYDKKSKLDSAALAAAWELDEAFKRLGIESTGDFTSRINRLGVTIVREVAILKKTNRTLSPEALTSLIFKNGIAELRSIIHAHTSKDSSMVLLFDNIDKAWPTKGVHEFDIRLVRLLIEALDKIRRDFAAQDRDFSSVVFLRNDIYELLLEETPDRGKAAEMRIDWTDRAKLRQVIFKRLQASSGYKSENFQTLWGRYFDPFAGNRDSFDYLVDHCLMRPRFLINIIENAVANAVNRGHVKVVSEDCRDAVRQHSHYLVSDFGYEIRDVSGLDADILFALVGVTELLTKEEVLGSLIEFGLSNDKVENAFDLMLWYGVLGIGARDGNVRFIYDYEYSIKRLQAEIRSLGEDVLYVVNPALHVALRT